MPLRPGGPTLSAPAARLSFLPHLRRSLTDNLLIHALTDVAVKCQPFGLGVVSNRKRQPPRSYVSTRIAAPPTDLLSSRGAPVRNSPKSPRPAKAESQQ